MNKVSDRLWTPVDITPLIFFRIAFGILGFSDVLSTFIYYHINDGLYGKGNVQFPYIGFEWVKPLPEPLFSLFIIIVLLAAIAIIAGCFYRVATVLFFLGFTYLFLLEKSFYLNHGYLFCWISFLMIFVPADKSFSLKIRMKPDHYKPKIPFFWIFPFPALMGIVYFYGGLAKLNSDWLRAEPLRTWLKPKADMPLIGPIVSHEWTAWAMSYGGVVLDLFVVFFLLTARFRFYALMVVIGFHVINHIIFNIGIFPHLSIVLTLLFFPPSAHTQFWNRWLSKFKILKKWLERSKMIQHFKTNDADSMKGQVFNSNKSIWTIALAIILGFHLTVPLRHHLFPGEVAWTEEGHKYSWRMKLRSKRGYGYFEIIDKNDGKIIKIKPSDELTRRQYRYLMTHPDMIWKYAQILKKRYRDQGRDVAVHAHISAKLNDREYRPFIDPETDLSEVNWYHFKPSPWIIH